MNKKRSRFRQVGRTRELSGPACALKDPAAIEVLRLWILDETPVCVFRLGQDPGRSWGFLLADVARTIGKAALDPKGTDSRDTVAAPAGRDPARLGSLAWAPQKGRRMGCSIRCRTGSRR